MALEKDPEMILKDLAALAARASEEDEDSVPPPPPLSSRNRSIFIKSFFRSKPKYDPTCHSPAVHVLASEHTSAIEVETADDWLYLKGDTRGNRSRRRFRMTSIFFSCIVLAALALALAVRMNSSQGVERSSSFAQANSDVQGTGLPSASPATPQDGASTTLAPSGSSSNTLAPSSMATAVPTGGATATSPQAHNSCTSFVTSDSSCYLFQSEINIIFENCSPDVDDWIGIWPLEDAMDTSNLPEPTMWLWTCGTQDCAGQVLADTLPFGGRLPVGTFVAHLVRLESDTAPYSSSYALSSAFDVSLTC